MTSVPEGFPSHAPAAQAAVRGGEGTGAAGRGPPDDLEVLVVDEVCLHRQCLAAALARHPGVRDVRTAGDLRSTVAAVRARAPDIVLVAPDAAAGHQLIRAVRVHAPSSRLIVLGASEDEDEVLACAEAGVHGFLLRSEPLSHLLRLMQAVLAGETLCTSKVSALLLRRVEFLSAERRSSRTVPDLTSREEQVLDLLDVGLSNQEIADRLGITVRTVKNHVHHVIEKVGARRRGEAVAEFRRLRGGSINGR